LLPFISLVHYAIINQYIVSIFALSSYLLDQLRIRRENFRQEIQIQTRGWASLWLGSRETEAKMNRQVLDNRSQSPWRLSLITDFFWGIAKFVVLFFKTATARCEKRKRLQKLI
jgi:hypothetical protein